MSAHEGVALNTYFSWLQLMLHEEREFVKLLLSAFVALPLMVAALAAAAALAALNREQAWVWAAAAALLLLLARWLHRGCWDARTVAGNAGSVRSECRMMYLRFRATRAGQRLRLNDIRDALVRSHAGDAERILCDDRPLTTDSLCASIPGLALGQARRTMLTARGHTVAWVLRWLGTGGPPPPPPVPEAWRSRLLGATAAPRLRTEGYFRCGGIAAGPDGRLYCSPLNASSVLVVDPATGDASPLHHDLEAGDGLFKYSGIAAGPDGKLYCSPLFASSVLVVDPLAGDVGLLRHPRFEAGPPLFSGIAAGSDGKLYCSPNVGSVLVVDPGSPESLQILSHERLERAGGYTGIAAAPNGKLYCSPRSASSVLVVDPSSGELSFLGHEALEYEAKHAKYTGIAAGCDGKLYCSPGQAASVLVIDPVAEELSFLFHPDLNAAACKYGGIAAGPHGKLYCSPQLASSVLVVDPSTQQLSFLEQGVLTAESAMATSLPESPESLEGSMAAGTCIAKYSGIAAGAAGKLYCAPLQWARSALIVDATECADRL